MPRKGIRCACSVANCENQADARGMCKKHYMRWYKRPDGDLSDPLPPAQGCSVVGCPAKHHSLGLCKTHLKTRKKEAPDITWEALKELLTYDSERGVFLWRVDRGKVKAGSVAGTISKDGFARVMVDHRTYSVPSLAYFYEHGRWLKSAKEQGELTQERLRELLDYDPHAGIFRHCLHKRGSRGTRIAGRVHKTGYRYITVDEKPYLAQRLAFLYMTGKWPAVHVDHRDRNRDNNAWDNLREATRKQNCGNQGARCNNKLGVKGVYRVRNKFRAQINVDYKIHHLGSFDTIEEASAAYAAAAKKHFGEFARS